MAAACGTPVEALDERSEYVQVTVNPDGTATMVSAAVPQRVRRGNGSWADVDTSLQPAADGSLSPVATMAPVRFSGGGSGPMASWQENGSTFTLSWPLGPLPAPTIEGDTAVYASVLPDVDLHVSATVEGFSYVLEVKTAAAAADPALAQMSYHVGGNVQLQPTSTGGVTVVDAAGNFFAQSPGAVMWDSSVNPAALGDPVGARAAMAEPNSALPPELASNASEPGVAAETGQVDVAVSGNDLVVTPAADMLTGPDTVFPVFIDPPFNKNASKWAYATSNGESNDTSNARMGLNPTGGALYRSYFQFDASAVKNTNVLHAEIHMELDHSWSCGPTWMHIYRTGAFVAASGSRLAWSGTGSLPLGSAATYLDDWEGNAHEGGECPQDNVTAIFDEAPVTADVDAVNTDTYTIGLCACNRTNGYESTQDRWKRWETSKSYLIATYDLPPYKPVAQPFTTTADCYQVCASPAIVRSTVPMLRFNVQTPFGGNTLTAVEIRDAPSDTATIVVDDGTFRTTAYTTPVTTAGTSPAVLAQLQVPAGKLANGITYYWRGTTKNENSLWSGWSPWYSFTVDTSPPAISSASSTQYPLKAWGAQVGTAGTFTFSGPSDVYDYTWWVDGGNTTTTTSTSVSYTPATDMVHTFHVKARDKAGNTGGTYDYQFWVKPLANRCWHWKLDESSGTSAADSGNTDANDPVCAPIGTSVTAMPGTLSGSVSFGAGYLGNAVNFTGSGGQITTGSAVVDTTKSFTVAAWVKPSSLAADATIISQDGTNTSGFQLKFYKGANSGAGGWCFTMRTSDSATATPVTACAGGQTLGVPTVGAWVHVAGIYDATTQTVTVHVSGGSASCDGETASAAFTTPWSAKGAFVMGRAKASEYWLGGIDGVHAYTRALSTSDVCKLAIQ